LRACQLRGPVWPSQEGRQATTVAGSSHTWSIRLQARLVSGPEPAVRPVCPCHLPTVKTGPHDSSRPKRRSRSEGPKRRTPATASANPRRSPHPEPTGHNSRKRLWNIRLTWKFWYPIGYQTIRGSQIFHANWTSRPPSRPAGSDTAHTSHHHPQQPPRHQHDREGPRVRRRHPGNRHPYP